MAAFAPRDRGAYMEHMGKVLADPTVVMKTIVVGGRVAGNVATFLRLDKREVCYWLGKDYWGQGIAARALAALLTIDRERPLYARVAKSNTRSLRVVEKCGFSVSGEDRYGDRGGEVVEEFVLRLD